MTKISKNLNKNNLEVGQFVLQKRNLQKHCSEKIAKLNLKFKKQKLKLKCSLKLKNFKNFVNIPQFFWRHNHTDGESDIFTDS